MVTAAQFWDKVARKYATDPIKNIAAYEATLERTRAQLGPDMHVLEIGCGTGSTALLLANSAKAYTGSDLSSEMIAIAQEKLVESPATSLNFTVSPAIDTQFDTGTFDRILSYNLLHLLPDLPGALNRAHGLLTLDGLLITKTPCLGDMRWFIRPMVKLMQWVGKAPYVSVFNRATLEQTIRNAGFTIIDSHTFDGAPSSVFIVAEKSKN